MKLYPNAYFNKIEQITIEFLQKNKIKALILDIDNTLIDYKQNLSENIVNWVKELRGQGIKFYLLSNTNKKEKVKKVANTLELPYFNFAKKPLKSGFLKTQRQLNENRCNMFTILVDPINKKDYWYTAWKRPIEDKIKEHIKYNNKS